MSWQDESECIGYNQKLWYPDIIDDEGTEWIDDGTIWEAFGDTSAFYEEGKALCDVCPVKDECLAHALENKERWGMWGGLTPIERRRIERRERRQRLKNKRSAQ